MAEKRGMPPWFFVVATIVSLLMVALYIQMVPTEGLSFWMILRIAFWVGLAGFFIWGFSRARKARRDGNQFVA
ncbi:MAG: hypothetical protein JSV86_02370 [Gemmatimonadota bacterium]|nr:MAG: hypothetical protein JSV86_02370 [Gemmatimonadota bacterium]